MGSLKPLVFEFLEFVEADVLLESSNVPSVNARYFKLFLVVV